MKHTLNHWAATMLAAAGLVCPMAGAQDKPMHTQTQFSIEVRLPVAEAMPLFGPEGERAWAGKHWDPHFVFPRPAHDQPGGVFTIAHGAFTAVWITTRFDLEKRQFQYAYFIPDIMVTTIDVGFEPEGSTATRVNVSYARTALTEAGREHVAVMTDGDRSAAKEWQSAIDDYLVKRGAAR